jgi:hypothetical protein
MTDIHDGADRRVTRLETHMEYIRRDLDEIKDAVKKIDLGELKSDLLKWVIGAFGFQTVVVVGSIIGALALFR